MEEKRDAYMSLVGNPERDQKEKQEVGGKIIIKWIREIR
jgi:hypothetical protein